jgi:hypothetical protein
MKESSGMLQSLDQIMTYVRRILDRDNKPYTDGVLHQMRRYFQYHDRLQMLPTDDQLQEVYLLARSITKEVQG